MFLPYGLSLFVLLCATVQAEVVQQINDTTSADEVKKVQELEVTGNNSNDDDDDGLGSYTIVFKFFTLIIGGIAVFAIVQILIQCCHDNKNITFTRIRKEDPLPCAIFMYKKDADGKYKSLEYIDVETIFDRLKRERNESLEKVSAVAADVTMPSLGMSEVARELLKEEVNVVIHLAANVRFDSSLKTIAYTNLKGTEQILKLCEELKHLTTLGAENNVLVQPYLLNKLGRNNGKESRVFPTRKVYLTTYFSFKQIFGGRRVNRSRVCYRKSTFPDDSVYLVGR
ncbi:hypothetical protein FQA39_LY18214 [Lamprigera yunnana]|nr:hypothetical protein FQA39_LY18214 [Lamprigera yunnana]